MPPGFVKYTSVVLPFTYILSLGLLAFFSYDIINTIYSINKFESFHPITVDKLNVRYTGKSHKNVFYFSKGESSVDVILMDTTHFPNAYQEIVWRDSIIAESPFYKNVPLYYSTKTAYAYYLNNNALWSKAYFFKTIFWKLCLIGITILMTFACLFILKKFNYILPDYRPTFIYAATILALILLGYLNWLAEVSGILSILIFITILASLILVSGSRKVPQSFTLRNPSN